MTLRSRQPGPSPEGKLLKLARDARDFSIRQAAALAGVSETHWRHVEAGFESKAGMKLPVTAQAPKLAQMARAVGLTPERLETEGERPDAAAILREILRDTQPPPPKLEVVHSGERQQAPGGAVQDILDDPEIPEDLKAGMLALIRLANEHRGRVSNGA